MNHQEALDWLYSFKQYGSKLGLDRITHLVNHLGNPQDEMKSIHVTGTNGKGSVCQFIGSILHEAGYKVGVYISPHLQRFSERMTVNTQEISEEDVAVLVTKIKPVVDAMMQQKNTPTFFEIVTAMAFEFFRFKKVDFAVVEVGLGGRYDATNIVSPVVSVITNISVEHTKQLGRAHKTIAFEKAGIIKNDTPVITAATNAAREVITSIAEEKNAICTIVNRDDWHRKSSDLQGQEFLIHGELKDYTVRTSLLGEIQGENIALAIHACEQLQTQGVFISDDDLIRGIAGAQNPGRMEIVATDPLIVLDGAHNPRGMEVLKTTLHQDFSYQQLIVVIGILADKDMKKMVATLIPDADVIIVTQADNPRACDPSRLLNIIQQGGYSKRITMSESLAHAIETAKDLAHAQDLICITGSLFTVGEARAYLVNQTKGHRTVSS